MTDVRPVLDPRELQRWHDIDARSFAADHVALPADPLEEQLPRLAGVVGDERHELWLLVDDDEAVGAGELRLPLHDNLLAAEVDLRVAPERRREGHGSALLAHLLGRVRELGRSRVFLETPEPLPVDLGDGPDRSLPAARLAHRAGARPVLAEIRRLLDVAAVGDDLPRRLLEQAQRHAEGYSVVQWVDRAPASLHGDLARLRARMSTDAPLGAMEWEPEAWDGERFRVHEELALARGRRVVGTAVRHDESGRLVAFTDIGVNAARPDVAYQWDTLVAPEHRGRRLGLLAKAANLRLLRATAPGVRWVNTWNAAVNVHMVAINDALGFRPVQRWWQWQLDLPDLPEVSARDVATATGSRHVGGGAGQPSMR